jgi:hypothetical protein
MFGICFHLAMIVCFRITGRGGRTDGWNLEFGLSAESCWVGETRGAGRVHVLSTGNMVHGYVHFLIAAGAAHFCTPARTSLCTDGRHSRANRQTETTNDQVNQQPTL